MWAAVAVVVVVALGALVVYRELGLRPGLALELIRMERADGDLRRQLRPVDPAEQPELWARIGRMDARHTKRLKEIVDEHGWPGRSVAGRRGSAAAWLLAQHATADPAFMRRALQLMRDAGRGEVDPHDVAYLSDRLEVMDGRPQRYGTQFTCREGRLELMTPLVDPPRVDERRRRAGLETFEEHKRGILRRDGPCPRSRTP